METRGLSLGSTETHTAGGGAPSRDAVWLYQHYPGQPQRAQAGLHHNDQQPRQPMTHTPALQDTPRTFRRGGAGQPEPRKEGLPWPLPVSEWEALPAFLGDFQFTCVPQDRTGRPQGTVTTPLSPHKPLLHANNLHDACQPGNGEITGSCPQLPPLHLHFLLGSYRSRTQAR